MSDYRMSGESGRILPGGMESELQRLPFRVAGIAVIVVAAIGWLSLLTWSISDPSLNRATSGAPSNILGVAGASLADMLLQFMGLASIALFLPPAAWGLTLASGEPVEGVRQRLVMWVLAIVLIASMLSILPQPKGWLLTHGLGGVIGDLGRSVFVRLGGFLDPAFAGMIGAIVAGYAGLWALMRACGVGLTDLRLLWHLPPRGRGWARLGLFAGAGYMLTQAATLKGRVLSALDRETGGFDPRGGGYWPADRQVHRPRVERPLRPAEGRFDARFGSLDTDQVDYAPPPVTVHRPPEPAEPADHARREPFFEGMRGFPAPEPPRARPVKVVPFQDIRPTGAAAAPTQPYSDAARRAEASPYAPPQPMQQQAHVQASYVQARQPAPQPQPEDDRDESVRSYPRPQPRHPSSAHQRHDDEAVYSAAERLYREEPRRATERHAPGPYAYPEDGEDEEAEPAFPARLHGFPARPDWERPAPPAQVQRPNPATQRAPAGRRATPPPRAVEDEEAREFHLPSLRLLTPAPERRNNPELSDTALGRKAELLHGVLEDFGIKGNITAVHPGPVITLYELEPARGTKSSRVIGLADDIARSMSAVSARVAVIPGRDAIGIELPNDNREVVFLRELLEAPEFVNSKGALPIALGKTISGAPLIVDLARMPHLLIAGTTGSGKSVGINAMILSLLYRLTPEQCRFILIDPKMLELSVYDDIPHLLTPVVTDPRKAITALKWTVNEMNSRYERMCKLGVRNIGGFNQKVSRAKVRGQPLTRTVQTGFDEETGQAIYEREPIDDSPMPYIVVVIDEMADLMMVAGKEIEFAVQRLSQMARAAGIHLIMATQRPSVDVITGTIKANFPSRVSFQVTSKIDSRTILGEQGAEQLLGAGDMLTMAAGGRIMRAHGPFVSDEEVERLVAYLKDQAEPDYLEGLLDDDEGPAEKSRRGGGDEDGGRSSSGDDVYDQAVEVVLKDRRPTTSYLQRRLGIGYNRAASLIERMEAEGLISPPNRTGKREVLTGEDE